MKQYDYKLWVEYFKKDSLKSTLKWYKLCKNCKRPYGSHYGSHPDKAYCHGMRTMFEEDKKASEIFRTILRMVKT